LATLPPIPAPIGLDRPLAWSAGTRCGRYEILFAIASGGMAQVYAARLAGEGGFERLVAIKRMLPDLTEDDAFVQMFLDEGRIAATIDSPNVVSTLDLARGGDGEPYLVLELVVGASLVQLMRGAARAATAIPIDVVVEIIAQSAGGLHDAHEAKNAQGAHLEIVHRDISPQNILVDVRGRARITDFGIARAVERATRTDTGQVKGKYSYFAPEQLTAKSYDRRIDVWALGVVAWELLAGRRLFGGRSTPETLDAVVGEAIPRLHELREGVPEPLSRVIARALERDPAARWTTAQAFQRALREAHPGADVETVAAFVRARAGESVGRLEAEIRAASGDSSVFPAPAPATVAFRHEAPVEGAQAAGTEASARSPGILLHTPTGHPARDSVEFLSPTPAETSAPMSRAILALAVVGALGLVGAAMAFFLRGGAPTEPAPMLAEPAPPSLPPADQAAPARPALAPAAAAPPEEVGSPDVAPGADGSRGVASSTPEPILPPLATGTDAPEAPRARPTRTSPTAPGAPASAAVPAAAETPRQAASAASTAEPATEVPRTPRRLHSLDEFDQQVAP